MALDARLTNGGSSIPTKKTSEQKAALDTAVAAEAARAKTKAQELALNKAVKNNPLTKITQVPDFEQIGPMIGNNLGKDAAVILEADPTLVERLPDATIDAAIAVNPKLAGILNRPEPLSKKEGGLSDEQKDAYALLKEAFTFYGLEELVPVIEGYMKNDVGPNQAKLLLRQEPAYVERFKGNEFRIAKGLNALSEADYLGLEDDYATTLAAYGVSDLFGGAVDAASRKAQKRKMAEVMGFNLSASEFNDRIALGSVRVKNTDTATKDAFMRFFEVNETDLLKYFISGEDRTVLQKKVQAAEISGARFNAGLGQSTLANASDLASLGLTREAAIKGYESIASIVPESEKLSSIYKSMGINYDVTTGEEEFLKGTASAKRARQKLIGREVDEFSGSSGNAQGAFSTNYLKKSSAAGQI